MANYLFNSSSSGETYNGKCLNVSDDSDWYPTVEEYPRDGSMDLSGGVAGRYIDTQWVAPQDTEWTMSGIYNVVMGVSYDMYSIHYKGNQTCDIYLGSNTEDLVLSESDKDYTPPTGTWKIYEEPPEIILPSSFVPIYFSWDSTTPPSVDIPDAIIINTRDRTDFTTLNVVDINGDATPITLRMDLAGSGLSTSGPSTGDNSGCLLDYQLAHGVYSSSGDTVLQLEIVLPLNDVFTISALGGRAGNEETRASSFTLEGYGTQSHLNATIEDGGNTDVCAVWENVVGTGSIILLTMECEATYSSGFWNGMNIFQTS